jgi:hypothetical protein
MGFGFGKAGALHESLGETQPRRVVRARKFLHGEREVGDGEVRFLLELNQREKVEPAAGSRV